jgi:hypothetical protein
LVCQAHARCVPAQGVAERLAAVEAKEKAVRDAHAALKASQAAAAEAAAAAERARKEGEKCVL